MTILESLFLGLLQGLTEFLPVSSSGHLLLASQLYDIDTSLLYVIMLHVGTLLAVLLVYRKTIYNIARHPIADPRLRYIIIASIPTFALALVARYLLPSDVLDGMLLPVGFAVTIVLLVLSKYLSRPRMGIANAKIPTLLLIGVTQGMAVLPGLSRSGSTISVMKLMGIEDRESGEFSFLLSIPVIMASAVVEIYNSQGIVDSTPWYCYCIGGVVAFGSGLIAIHTVQRVLRRGTWMIFAIYLIIPLIISLILL